MEFFGIEVFDIIKDGCCTAERPGDKKKKKWQPETFLLLLRKCLDPPHMKGFTHLHCFKS